jgi:hypothetical protein
MLQTVRRQSFPVTERALEQVTLAVRFSRHEKAREASNLDNASLHVELQDAQGIYGVGYAQTGAAHDVTGVEHDRTRIGAVCYAAVLMA